MEKEHGAWRRVFVQKRAPLAAGVAFALAFLLQSALVAAGTQSNSGHSWVYETHEARSIVKGELHVVPGGTVLIDKAGDERCSFWTKEPGGSFSACSPAPTYWEAEVPFYVLTPSQEASWNRSGPVQDALLATTASRLWRSGLEVDVPDDASVLVGVFVLPNVTDPTIPHPRVGSGNLSEIAQGFLLLCGPQPAFCFDPLEGDYVAYRRGFATTLFLTEILVWASAAAVFGLSVLRVLVQPRDHAISTPRAPSFSSSVESYLGRLRLTLRVALLFWALAFLLVVVAGQALVEFLGALGPGQGWRHLPPLSLALVFAAFGPLLWAEQEALQAELRRWGRLMDSPPIAV